jgi:peptidoglycan/xylan/chitin deacetylase (PgdA/CDA1 family)
MKDHMESDNRTYIPVRKKVITLSFKNLFLLLMLITPAVFLTSCEDSEPPVLVIRVDDIQDYGFREAQLFLLDESITNQVPLSLAVIAGMFGEDREIVQKVGLAVNSGSEVTVHGWEHEDLANLSVQEQADVLYQSKSSLKEILGIDVNILVPPMFNCNANTIAAMHLEGYSIISTIADYNEPGLMSGVINLPATIELSDYSNGIWTMKKLDAVKTEITKSVQKYGFAVIVTHPQEFMVDGELDRDNTEFFRTLITNLAVDYSFETLETLGSSFNGQK